MMVAGRKVLLRVYLWALLVEKQDNVLPFLILLFSIAAALQGSRALDN